MTSYCEKSDLPRTQCALACCRNLSAPRAVPAGERSFPFRAKYDGRCQQSGCFHEIDKGDLISYIDGRVACGSCS